MMDDEANIMYDRWTYRTHRPEPVRDFEYDVEMAGSLRLQGGMGASVARIASLLMASDAQQCSS
jgi:hypothetical protein